jgi:hypothetical protein
VIDMVSPNSLLDRFPHLQREICLLVKQDPGFRQLSTDYELLTRSLRDTRPEANDDREEIIGLKTSLEVEALEMLSQARRR